MFYSVALTELDSSQHSLGRVHEVRYDLNHTALHVANLVLKDPSFDVVDRAPFSDADIALDGVDQFLGEVTRVEEDFPSDGQDQLKVFGPAYELTRGSPSSPVQYQWEARHLAIRDYYNNQASATIAGTVHRPDTTTKANDTKFQDMPGFVGSDDVYTPASDEPIVTDNPSDEIRAVPTAFPGVEDDFTGSYDVHADTTGQSTYHIDAEYASIGPNGSSGGIVRFTFTPEYTIPQDRVRMRIHYDFTGAGEIADAHIRLNGQEIADVPPGGGPDPVSDNMQWSQEMADGNYSNGDLVAGNSYEANVELDFSSGDDLEYEALDCIVVWDADYPPTTFGEPDSFEDTVVGPAPAPQDISILPEKYSRSWRLVEGRIESTWNDVSNGQQLELSPDDGTNYLSASNSSTITADFDGNDLFGDVLQPRLTLSAFGSNSWLSQRATPQKITDYKVYGTTDTLPIITNESFSSDDFDNIVDLHQGGFRFVTDPTIRNPITIESFVEGDSAAVKSDTWRTTEASRTRDVRGYANEVTLNYTDTSGTETTFTMQDQDEISAKSRTVIPREFTATQQLTTDQARNRARNHLLEVTGIDRIAGSIEAWAKLLLPGYTYPVPEWSDVQTSLTRTSYREDGEQAVMSLQFSHDTDTTAQLSQNRKDIQQLKEDV